MSLLLAVDVGTTNLKAAVFDLDGRCVGIEKSPTIAHYDSKGHSVYKPEEIWGTISELLRKLTDSLDEDISAVSVTSMTEAVVPLDKDGRELFDIITWFDTRSIKEAEDIVAKIGQVKLFSITGLDPNPIFSLCKMLWMKNNNPEVFQRASQWLQMADYIIYKLSGVLATDYTLATRTLAFDVRKNDWSDEILDLFNVDRSLFPPVYESGTKLGGINHDAAIQTGIPEGTPVVIGGNDHPCASLAAGVLNGNKILDSSGTAEAFIYVSQKHQEPPMEFKGQRTCRYLDKDRYALWGGIISSGASFEWAYKLLTQVESWGLSQSPPEYAQILSQVEEVPIGSNGVMFIPHMRGSGAPFWDPKMTGSFLGLKTTNTPQELLRAVLEGLAFQARMIVEMHEQIAESPVEALCVVGGSGKNLLWQQIKADVIQKPIEICEEPEASLLGAAILAGVGVGLFKDIATASTQLSKRNRQLVSNEKNKENYQKLYEIYCDAYEATKTVSHRLKEF
jgi:xylulokinase